MEGKPTTRVIIAAAVLLLSLVLFAFAINHVVGSGTCSSTGYTQYGPAPRCPAGSTLDGLLLVAALPLVIISSIFLGSNIGVAGMFVAIGIGAILDVTGSASKIGTAFPLVFGGCFLVAGLVWAVASSISMWNARPTQSSAPLAFTPRIALALSLWAASIGGGVAAGTLTTTGSEKAQVDITTALLPRPAGAAVISGADRASLFRAANLAPVLSQIARRFGQDGNVVALAVFPGQLDAVVADANDEARLVTARISGGLTVGPAVTFQGSRQAVDVSQLSAGVPQRLARSIAKLAKLPPDGLDRFVMDLNGPLAHWRVYPTHGSVGFEALLTGGSIRQITLTTNRHS